MLIGEGNAGDRWKTKIYKQKKQLCTCSTLFLYTYLRLFCMTTTWNFQRRLRGCLHWVIDHEWRLEDPSNRKILEDGITLRWVYMQNTDIDFLVVSVLQDAGGYAISRQNNLELHLGCYTCWLIYFTLVCLWWGRTVARVVGVWSRDYQIFSDGLVYFLTHGAPLARFAR